MTMEITTNNLVTINGRIVGRVDRDSYQMLSGVRGKTTFYTGKIGTFDRPHEISVPLYVPKVAGSVSDWMVNPAFVAEVEKFLV